MKCSTVKDFCSSGSDILRCRGSITYGWTNIYRFSPTPVFFVIVRLLWLYINGLKPCRMKGIKISTKKKSCRDHKTKSLTIIIIFFADKHLITYTGSIQFFRHFLFVKMSHSTSAKLWTKLRTHNNPNSIRQYNW